MRLPIDRYYYFNTTTGTCGRRYPYYGFLLSFTSPVTFSQPSSTFEYTGAVSMSTYPLFSTGQISGNRFVAPVAGYYAFYANVRFDLSSASSNFYRLWIVKNGVLSTGNGLQNVNNGFPNNCTSALVTLCWLDFIESLDQMQTSRSTLAA